MDWIALIIAICTICTICEINKIWSAGTSLTILFTGILLYYVKKVVDGEEKERRERQEKIKQEMLLKEEKEQERIKQEALVREKQKKEREQKIAQLVSNSQLLSQESSERINSAQNALDTAEQEYKEGAFVPFWDAIERAVTNLAHFHTGVTQIAQNCAAYQTEIKRLDSPPLVSDWKRTADFPDATAIAGRLQKVVQSAQKNFQFAVIYEQRKTNQILVAGFTGLGQALSEIAYRIDESAAALSVVISDLSFTVSDVSEKAIEAGREDTRAVIESIRVIRKQTKAEAEAEAEARREHEQREREMLDNIQRGEKPSFPNYRGGLQ